MIELVNPEDVTINLIEQMDSPEKIIDYAERFLLNQKHASYYNGMCAYRGMCDGKITACALGAFLPHSITLTDFFPNGSDFSILFDFLKGQPDEDSSKFCNWMSKNANLLKDLQDFHDTSTTFAAEDFIFESKFKEFRENTTRYSENN